MPLEALGRIECPLCGASETDVVDTRGSRHGIRRRRECRNCHQRFTTLEQVAAEGSSPIKLGCLACERKDRLLERIALAARFGDEDVLQAERSA